MNTGTPLDITPFGAVLSGIGFLYWLLVFAAVGLILWKVKGWVGKAVLSSFTVLVMVGPLAWHAYERQQEQQQYKAKVDAAMTLFEERCKNAGEKIYRTVENVDGVVWMKWREPGTNHNDQFKLDDPYGKDCDAERCILQLLRVIKGADLKPEEAQRHSQGYRFVESIDPSDGKRYRYTAVIKSVHTRTPDEIQQAINNRGTDPGPYVYDLALEREPTERFTARYGVTWDDVSTHEDRERWIAGGSIKVIDLQTNEVIAERIGYMVDKGQGGDLRFRSAWGFAQQFACPEFPQVGPSDPRRSRSGAETRDFAIKVLKLVQGEQ